MRRCITNKYSPSGRRNDTQNGEKTRRYRDLQSATTKKHFPHLQCSQAKYLQVQGLDPAAEICRWYGIISCCLQRANAKILRGEPVPARHSAPPPRLFFFFLFVRKAKAQDCKAIPRHAMRRCNTKQLLAVGPEKLHTVGTKQKHGDTETYKALPRKNIFRTFSVVRRNTTKYNLEALSPTTYPTRSHFQQKRISIIHYATLR